MGVAIADGFPQRNNSIVRVTETVRLIVLGALDVIGMHSGVLLVSKDKKGVNETCPCNSCLVRDVRQHQDKASHVVCQELQNVTCFTGRNSWLENKMKPDVDDGANKK